jgi:hypothetical protein
MLGVALVLVLLVSLYKTLWNEGGTFANIFLAADKVTRTE